MTSPTDKKQSKGKVVESKPVKVKIICAIIELFANLPDFIGRLFAWLFAQSSKLFKTRGYRTSLTNLEICLPELELKQRKVLAIKSLKHTGRLFFEASKIWRKCQGERYIDNVFGDEAVKACLAQGKGVLFTGSHIGNWEVALYYLGSNYKFHCMYRPPRQQEMDEVISGGRCQNSTAMVRGDSRGVMHLIKILKAGEVAAVLSDQEPGRGAGVFVPFCGKNALTMTLVQKIQQKSGAELFEVAAIKNAEGLYDIHLKPVKIVQDIDEFEYATEVNKHLEQTIRRYPEQYQWSYKRFKTTEDGGPNPYR
ncbi:lauroyl acyltransferase [Kangiella japonica]|uniref:Lauroyl acyltransferase n=1 Tax=Kangiella japonica TaxID=647384 RepID=A0ABN0T0M0_9GAMM